MTAVASATRTSNVGSVRTASHSAPTGARAALPSPRLAGPAGYQDALLLLMQDEVQQASANKAIGALQARSAKEAIAKNLKKELDALAEQRKAEKESHGFWNKLKKFAGTIAKVAAVVASVAGSVFSGGSTLLIAAAIVSVALSGGAMVVRETKMFGDLSDKIGLGMDIASAVVGVAGCGAGLLKLGGTAVEQTATWAKVTSSAAQLTGGAATAAGAVAGGFVAGAQHDADLAAADAEDARGRMEISTRERQMVIDWLERVSDLEAESTDITVRTLEGCSQAADVAIAGVRG
jgi:hypothetical protein